ncbi:MAG: 1-deoxy-D-xylulose-5-phosphate synthase [Erysipelotrichaceae bacterium]|nr:1-deoxy-D-xylulose-5-phosphate synthase [Erysipelotrichaceae bacterium]
MTKILDSIREPNDIKKVPADQLDQLSEEIRDYLLEVTSRNGGHLASNLGMVEITIALHRFMDFPKDKLVFDVGHQSYVHKILTGRKDQLMSLRQLDSVSGFPDPQESDCDSFVAGHASTSIAVASGFAAARQLNKTDEKIVAVIGDGAITGGLTMEALNNLSQLKSNLIIVLNDNERSIAKNVGGMANYLGRIRTSNRYTAVKKAVRKAINSIPVVGDYLHDGIYNAKESIKRLFVPGMMFEDMGIIYIGPIDGHNIEQVYQALNNAWRLNKPVIIHTLTVKGKGYKLAEDHPAQFHGVDRFDIKTGQSLKVKKGPSYTDVFSAKMLELAKKDPDVIAITAAMPYGTGLYDFHKQFPRRFYDVGIAEEYAVTFAGALAKAGKKPVAAIYSTFLQRAYDQIVNDVCMQNLHVVFAIDRAGIVGNDGKTHQGIFDEAFLTTVPNMTVMSPKNRQELEDMLEYAIEVHNGPIAVRYPRSQAGEELSEYRQPIACNRNEVLVRGKKILLLATGVMVKTAMKVREELLNRGYEATVVNIRFLSHIDIDLIKEMAADHQLAVMMEEVVYTNSYSQRLQAAMKENGIDMKLLPITLEDRYLEHGSIEELRKRYGLDEDSVLKKILDNAEGII